MTVGRRSLSRPLQWLLVLVVIALWLLVQVALAPRASAAGDDVEDEILFYRQDGSFALYDPTSSLGLVPIDSGTGYSQGWDSIVALDMDGGIQDEMLFYRKGGSYRYYNVTPAGGLVLIRSGTGYSQGWDSIVALDMDGDADDELLFYRRDGSYRYYDVTPNAGLVPILTGTGYSQGWDSIVAMDINGDGDDELFFYRMDGSFRYYNVTKSAGLVLIRSGLDYSQGWDVIAAMDLDGDRDSEVLFYRSEGTYRYYHVSSNGSLSSPFSSGTGYSQGWDTIVAANLQGDLPTERVSRFTTFFNCCESRVTNIRTMARAVDGTVVMPGETFSISEVVGPTTSSKGYVPAGYLVGGEGQCCAVGGGVSQFGTTIHNAVFWGGFDVVSHRPHSAWISRYPLGIEATLVYGSIDYKFTNDTVTPVTIRTSSTGSSVTVEIWGNQGGWQMSGFHPTGARTSRISILDRGGSAAKRVSGAVYGSAPGRVRIVRTLTEGGKSTSETWYWTYLN
ncbi:MAG TPA: VanW family protein [Acidimicrobiia bacterium]|nr:VanW family protein [Acidimicrobiia bacterium]